MHKSLFQRCWPVVVTFVLTFPWLTARGTADDPDFKNASKRDRNRIAFKDEEGEVVIGKLGIRRNRATDRVGYAIVDSQSGVHYSLSYDGDELDDFVGKQVRARGTVKLRADGKSGFIRAEEVVPIRSRAVQPAQYMEEMPLEGPVITEGEILMDGDLGGEIVMDHHPGSFDLGHEHVGEIDHMGTAGECASCGGCRSCGGCQCGPAGWNWVRVEYLYWMMDGMRVPPLVTGSPAGTARANAGVLGLPSTSVLFGDDEMLDQGRSGIRARMGAYLDYSQCIGIEGEYFGFEEELEQFRAASDSSGNPIIARPFFNVNPRNPTTLASVPAREDAELVSFPGVLAGAVTVDGSSALHSAGARLVLNMCCKNFSNPCGTPCRHYRRADLLLGYRYMRLRDGLAIQEDLTTLDNTNQRFSILDQFRTENDFHGGEIGVLWQAQRHRWTVELMGKVALGNVHQVVAIDGATNITQVNGSSTRFPGGLLAQRTNSGRFERDAFGVIPEFGATLGFYVTQRLRLTGGYSFLYWGNVVRAGDQIDLDLNPDLLPPEAVPFTGASRPAFAFRETDFFAHGLNAGLDYRW